VFVGKTALVFGTKGDSMGKFKRPSGLAVNSLDVVYVTDISTSQLLRIYPDGHVEVVLHEANLLNNPTGIDVDSYDNIYIASSGKNKILKLVHPSGPLMMVASSKSKPDILAPGALCVDIQDNVYIANGHKDILLLTPKGQSIKLN
jgi:DNA-binding beta-propeller fold protein YncE